MEILVVAAALWFFYEALKSLLGAASVAAPQSQLILFVYCLLAGLTLLYEGGWLLHH